MFGYISIDKPELKIKDYRTYQAYYCGLCREIKKSYSQKASMFLNYDCAFLYLLFAALGKNAPQFSKGRCIASWKKKKSYAEDDGAAFAAGINILLAMFQIRDDIADGKKKRRLLLWVYRNEEKKAKQAFPEAAALIQRQIAALTKMERQKESNLDRVADAFATLLAEIFKMLPGDGEVLFQMGYHLGRWIYFADAFADLEEDQKKGNYNPFLARYPGQTREEMKEEAGFLMRASLARAGEMYALLPIQKQKGILDNIMYAGLYRKTEGVLEKRKVEQNGPI